MSGFKNFAVAGVGHIGEFVVEELLKLKSDGRVSSVIILTRGRTDATIDKLTSLGATIAPIDWSAPSTITSALTSAHIDVVISALPGPAHHLQPVLADAAKAAHVKLFLPSEWGSRSTSTGEDGKEYFSSRHHEMHKRLEEINLPYALVFTGMWSDFIFNPMFGWNIQNGKIEIWGEGNKPITFTTRRDAGRFVAHVLTTLPPEELYWKHFCLEGDRMTLNEICEGYQTKTGEKLEITHHPIAEQEKALKENTPASVPFIVAWLLLSWDKGSGLLVKNDDELANKLWPEWNPMSAVDALIKAFH
ncbi:NAD-binding protein [Neolentinus lepideus HHB14362 ss-1]|uniref:NAD-binding protein n=1 Tax=Neolentinus lepideus HHB14362 ss-1 TaxID=1314782 RepID=A0A165Q527_9AGAM|nr:NAD-binding protein [Neolentinus lepideus HHB14362 ss-1]